MRKLIVFNQVSLDGFMMDEHGDMSWAHKSDPEWNAFGADNASGDGELVFGRVTYEMMESYWPTLAARRSNPVVAERMNDGPKVVFSRKLKRAAWPNTKLVKGDIVAAMKKMKAAKGPTLVIMGSGTIVTQMTSAGLIDEYQVVVIPVILGAGRTMFEGVEGRPELVLDSTRAFKNGNVLLRYERDPKAVKKKGRRKA